MSAQNKKTNWRWAICGLLFASVTINYLDRQVLSLTYEDFIKPLFHWDDNIYGTITGFFSLAYAISMLFAGRFVDWIGTKKGFLWAIGVWSFGACLHAFCGVATEWILGHENHAAMRAVEAGSSAALAIGSISMWLFLVARAVLALGEAGNFPAANKVNAEFFPKKDRAFSLAIFNAGASVGALAAPLTIPPLAEAFGWEMAFIIIGGVGFIWMGFWVFMYDKPEKLYAQGKYVGKAELDYIEQDKLAEEVKVATVAEEKKMPFLKCFTFRQTWAFAVGKFMTDGVWWFFLFWTPSYLSNQFGIKMTEGLGMALIFTLYGITTVLSIFGGKLPSIFISRSGSDPYAARMKAMLIFAFFPLLVLLVQPLAYQFSDLGRAAAWIPVLLISMGCAAHQSWSANLFTTVGDMFPKSAIATITGIGGMAGGLGSLLLQKSAGSLFTNAEASNMAFMGFNGKPAGYFIIFCVCAVAYLIGWTIMKSLVPKYSPITVK